MYETTLPMNLREGVLLRHPNLFREDIGDVSFVAVIFPNGVIDTRTIKIVVYNKKLKTCTYLDGAPLSRWSHIHAITAATTGFIGFAYVYGFPETASLISDSTLGTQVTEIGSALWTFDTLKIASAILAKQPEGADDIYQDILDEGVRLRGQPVFEGNRTAVKEQVRALASNKQNYNHILAGTGYVIIPTIPLIDKTFVEPIVLNALKMANLVPGQVWKTELLLEKITGLIVGGGSIVGVENTTQHVLDGIMRQIGKIYKANLPATGVSEMGKYMYTQLNNKILELHVDEEGNPNTVDSDGNSNGVQMKLEVTILSSFRDAIDKMYKYTDIEKFCQFIGLMIGDKVDDTYTCTDLFKLWSVSGFVDKCFDANSRSAEGILMSDNFDTIIMNSFVQETTILNILSWIKTPKQIAMGFRDAIKYMMVFYESNKDNLLSPSQEFVIGSVEDMLNLDESVLRNFQFTYAFAAARVKLLNIIRPATSGSRSHDSGITMPPGPLSGTCATVAETVFQLAEEQSRNFDNYMLNRVIRVIARNVTDTLNTVAGTVVTVVINMIPSLVLYDRFQKRLCASRVYFEDKKISVACYAADKLTKVKKLFKFTTTTKFNDHTV